MFRKIRLGLIWDVLHWYQIVFKLGFLFYFLMTSQNHDLVPRINRVKIYEYLNTVFNLVLVLPNLRV